jgi:hypothetical protein
MSRPIEQMLVSYVMLSGQSNGLLPTNSLVCETVNPAPGTPDRDKAFSLQPQSGYLGNIRIHSWASSTFPPWS